MRFQVLGLIGLALLVGTARLEAREIHIAAQGTQPTGVPDGSAAFPYPSLGEAFAAKAIAGGDRVLLARGDHGGLWINQQVFLSPVDIGPAPGAKVRVTGIDVRDSRNLVFHDLQVWPDAPLEKGASLVTVKFDSQDISFNKLDIRSQADVASFPTWTKQEWLDRAVNAVFLQGSKTSFRNSTLTGIRFGIQSLGTDNLIEGNLIDGFSGDGMRGLGDRSIFRRNTVRNCVLVDGNHSDAFQSWSLGPDKKSGKGIVTGLVIDGNTFLEWQNPVVSPVKCQLQGVGLFDGMYKDFTIQNNLIAVTAFHGIAVYGGINTRILNNTVVDPTGTPGKRPWIRIGRHKDGRSSQGGVIANNMAMLFKIEIDPVNPAVQSKNLVLSTPLRDLESPQTGDYRPKRGGSAIDAGDAKLAPRADLTGVTRPNPSKPDLGAIERR